MIGQIGRCFDVGNVPLKVPLFFNDARRFAQRVPDSSRPTAEIVMLPNRLTVALGLVIESYLPALHYTPLVHRRQWQYSTRCQGACDRRLSIGVSVSAAYTRSTHGRIVATSGGA